MFRKLTMCSTIAAMCLLAAIACQKHEAAPPAATGAGLTAATPDTPAQPGGTMANTMRSCDGVGGIQCSGAKDYCHLADGQCTMPDASGTCEKKPDVCTEMSAPVCGCDGKTYDNACKAASAGISVSAVGACK